MSEVRRGSLRIVGVAVQLGVPLVVPLVSVVVVLVVVREEKPLGLLLRGVVAGDGEEVGAGRWCLVTEEMKDWCLDMARAMRLKNSVVSGAVGGGPLASGVACLDILLVMMGEKAEGEIVMRVGEEEGWEFGWAGANGLVIMELKFDKLVLDPASMTDFLLVVNGENEGRR